MKIYLLNSYRGRILFFLGAVTSWIFLINVEVYGQINQVKLLDYDEYGNPLEVQDANGAITKYYYGSNNDSLSQGAYNGVEGVYLTGIERIISSGANLIQTATYDNLGRLIVMYDENQNKTNYEYDGLNRLEKIRNHDGQLIEDYQYEIGFSGSNYTDSNSNYIRTRNYTDSQTLTTYEFFDGLGRQIQTQQRGGGTSIITATQYNERGLPEVVSRPFEVSNQNSFLADAFGSGFDPPGDVDSDTELDDYYDGSSGGANYPYTYTIYEDSPLARPIGTRRPGGSNYETTTTYGLNTETNENFSGTNELDFDNNTLAKQTITDENGVKSWQFTDGWGRTVMDVVDLSGNNLVSASAAYDIFTGYEYDLLGNLVKVHEPKGWGSTNNKRTYEYNPLGQLIGKKLPDQTFYHAYRYDKKGNLRFHRDPNLDGSGDHYYYTKYDDLDRQVEIGKYNSSSYFNDLSKINNPDWPTSDKTAYIYYDYGETYIPAGATNEKGRLTRTKYKDFNSSNWGTSYYSYNDQGLIEWVKQSLPELDGYVQIQYLYDELGRVTRLFFNSTVPGEDYCFWFTYDELGRLKYIDSNENNSGPTQREAEYLYYADGQVKQLILGDGVQTLDYEYSIQGWMDDIDAGPHFEMRLDYELNGNINGQYWLQAAVPNAEGRYSSYEYDSANRLISSDVDGVGLTGSLIKAYHTEYTYDKNGNMESLSRWNEHGNLNESNYNDTGQWYAGELEFSIDQNSNHLQNIWNEASNLSDDIFYDHNGNVDGSNFHDIDEITYDWRNLPIEMQANGETIHYVYDGDGNRVKKEVVGGPAIYYIRGADGEVVAAHDGTQILYWNLPNGIGRIDNY